MKSSIKIVTVVALCIGLTLTILAQSGRNGKRGNPEKRAEMQTIYLTKKLDLSDAQEAELKQINEAYAQKMIEAREKMEALMDEMWEQKEKGMQAKAAEIKAILNPEQVEIFETIMDERVEKRENRSKGKRGERRNFGK